ncbi:MAG TPA: hypothetical protein VLF39_00930 [Candidatus Saccharimonadales bacterium]|nr:hypothetical protein [Candidatus Saccharimonadales bacterium]
MVESELEGLVKYLPLVEDSSDHESILDSVTISYIDESLKISNPTLYKRIHDTIKHVYKEIGSNRSLSFDKNGRPDLSPDQFRGVIALSVLRGAAEVIIDVAEPLRESHQLEQLLNGGISDV